MAPLFYRAASRLPRLFRRRIFADSRSRYRPQEFAGRRVRAEDAAESDDISSISSLRLPLTRSRRFRASRGTASRRLRHRYAAAIVLLTGAAFRTDDRFRRLLPRFSIFIARRCISVSAL